MQQRQIDVMEPLRLPLMAIGLALVIIGAFLLIYIGYLVYQVINNPEEIRIVEFLLEQVRLEDKAIYGITADQAFEINWSESLRTVMFVLIGVLVISVLAGILKTLIGAGIQILRLATAQPGVVETPAQARASHNAIDRGD